MIENKQDKQNLALFLYERYYCYIDSKGVLYYRGAIKFPVITVQIVDRVFNEILKSYQLPLASTERPYFLPVTIVADN